MAAKKDTKKVRHPEFEVVWNGDVPELTYFQRNEYKTVGKVEKGQFILTWDGWDEEPDKAHLKIMTSLDRRGVPYKRFMA